ncbi:hypothetical protein BmR1_04g05195 [Babesia microti strain RI]|uniref:Uncharacterized protein n=1 Tax=Babesia microti (strain RI) TaxID=1133968 RepID=A0A1N6LXC8_BABMR|nr:hypothetical protein BmR1_04g05195 [Babesia microti strain RI]SIO73525.1 hypothetical protein BmR1_04g05195 [Babesia microti strain RI]|eukprot:XP_021337617.1 hypothetical protein BmR1_04g05195 [Babesia microti strain RI]
MSTHVSHISSHHPSTHAHTSDLLYPPSHKASTHASTYKPSSHKQSSHISSLKASKHHPSTHASTRASSHRLPSQNASVNHSVHPSMYSMQDFGEDSELYEPTPVEDQELLADNCYDNYQLMISVFLKLSKEFEKISDEVDECIKMAQKAFEMVDFTQYDDPAQYDEPLQLEEDPFGDSASEVPMKSSVRFSYKNIIHDDPNIAPSCIPLSSTNQTMSYNPSSASFGRALSQPISLSADRISNASMLTKNPSIARSIMTAKSFGGEKSVASLNKSIAASIISGKSLAETSRTISKKVLEDNKSVLSSKSNNRSDVQSFAAGSMSNKSAARSRMSHATLANPSIAGSIARSRVSHATLANPSIARSNSKSRVSHATLANPSIARSNSKSRVSHATLANPSIAGSVKGNSLKARSMLGSEIMPKSMSEKSVVVEEPMSIHQSLSEKENPQGSLSLGRSMMSGIKSIMTQGKSMVMGQSGSFASQTKGSDCNSVRESKMTMRSQNSKASAKSGFGASLGSKSGLGQENPNGTPSMMSRIKSFFSRASTQNNEQEIEDDEHIDPLAVQQRFVDLWERIIGKLLVTSNQFKALSDMTKDPAIVPNDAFEVPIMELPTHADGQPLSADELIHALHNTMIPQKQNQSKVHSLIINVIVAHCEIRNAERFLQQLSEKMEIQPKRLKSLSAKRIERTKMIVKQCGDELVSTDSHYENYINSYYEALERDYPPALGTLEDPPLKHSPTCPSQIEAQELAIYEIRDQYIREKISTFDDLVTSWLLDYTNICREAGEQMTVQDENLGQD